MGPSLVSPSGAGASLKLSWLRYSLPLGPSYSCSCSYYSYSCSYYYRVLWYFVGEILFCLFGWTVHDSKGWCIFASNINDIFISFYFLLFLLRHHFGEDGLSLSLEGSN